MEAHFFPRFLPDNRHFLYMKGAAPGMRAVFVGDLEAAPDAQSNTPILSTDYGVAVAQAGPGAPPMVLFLRDSTLVAQQFDMRALALTGEPVAVADQVAGMLNTAIAHVSASRTGALVYRTVTGNNRQLTWFNRQGDVVGRPGERAPFGTMKVSPDGTRAVVVRRSAATGQLGPVDRRSGQRCSTRFTFDPGRTRSPSGRQTAAPSPGRRSRQQARHLSQVR